MSGGVLSGGEIQRLALIKENFDIKSLRRSGYDVRVGAYAITGSGRRDFDEVNQIVLQPGESAAFPTEEVLKMPPDVAGNIAIKTRAASQGLLLLSGLLIDPEFEGPLRLSVANVGSNPFVLRERDQVGSVQFFPVVGPPGPPLPRPRSALPKHPLAFLGHLAHVSRAVEGLEREVRRTRDLTANVITLGFFLVGATILGVALSTVLSIGSDSDLVSAVRNATPHSVTGKLLVAVSIASAAWAIYSVSVVARGSRDTTPPGARDDKAEARARLRLQRGLHLLWLMLAVPVVAVVLVWASTHVSGHTGRYLWPIVISVLIGIWAKAAVWVWKPITDARVEAEMQGPKASRPPTPAPVDETPHPAHD